MKRKAPWRGILAALAALVVLGLLAAVALIHALFPAEEARTLVIKEARRELGREVRLARVEAGLRGVSLHGLEISARPNFAAGTFFSAARVRVQPNWRALLGRHFVIAAVAIDHPIVRVERRRDGRFDFSAAGSSGTVARSKPGVGPELDVSRLTVVDGELDYVDDASSSSWRATDLNLSVRSPGRAAPLVVELSARVRGAIGGRTVDARVAVDGTVEQAGGRRDIFTADATRFVVEQEGLRLAGSARVAGLDAPRVGVDAELSLSGRRLAKAALSARIGPAVDVAARVETEPLDARALARLLPRSRLPDLPAAALTARFSLAGGDLLVPTVVLSAAGGRVAVSGRIVDAQTDARAPDLSADVEWSLPEFRAGDVFFLSGLPSALVVPPLRVSGRVRLQGPDAILDGLIFAAPAGTVALNGRIADARSGARPNLNAALDLALPPLTDADLPFVGVPAGLRLPATRWTGTIGYAPGVLRLRALRARAGGADVQADGDVALKPRTTFAGRLRARSLDFAQLGALTAAARAFKPTGRGSFDFRFLRGPRGRVVLGSARVRGLSLDAGGIPLRDFSGTVIADGSRIEAPGLTGRLDGSALALDLSVDDYARAPEIRVAAKLDRFDLGHYLAAKRKLIADTPALAASTAAAPAASAAPVRTRGSLDIAELVHPNATVRDVHADWILTGVTSDLRALGGRARLRVGGGRIRSLGALADEEKVLKVLLFPLLIVQKITSLGGLRLFPDFNDIQLRSVAGDYSFKKGVMTLEHSRMESNEAAVAAAGTIDLPLEKLGLVVRAQVAAFVPIAVDVGGTFSRPTAKVGAGAFIVDPAKQLLLDMLGR
ncbi:MAG: hypothetical protein HKL90_01965 [Elusimicrobia bacterium]|nr:hypothetical protein [Elusimicrobiota bacterium]